MNSRSILMSFFLAAMLLTGCRGMESDRPPVHLNPNMDDQEKFVGQEENSFFENNMAMRPPVAGTVARGFLRDDAPFYFGRNPDGSFIAESPVPLTRELLDRGQERYNIYCAVCHGEAGDGRGILMVGNGGDGYGYVPATNYHDDRLRNETDGYMYDVIANGIRNMPGYAQQIAVADRWAIVAYIRALQRTQNASEGDVPQSEMTQLQ